MLKMKIEKKDTKTQMHAQTNTYSYIPKITNILSFIFSGICRVAWTIRGTDYLGYRLGSSISSSLEENIKIVPTYTFPESLSQSIRRIHMFTHLHSLI